MTIPRAARRLPRIGGVRIALAALVVPALVLSVVACNHSTPSAAPAGQPTPTSPASSPSASQKSTDQPAPQKLSKVLTIVEENHSLNQMRDGMPYLYSLAEQYAYSTNYTAIRHPSLPNYLAIAGGDTFGVKNDQPPAAHIIHGESIFGQALAAGMTAGIYAQSMKGNCVLTGSTDKGYAVKHNAWAYFVDERAACNAHDVSGAAFDQAAQSNTLPNVGMLIPNKCNDAHDTDLGCDLGTADDWLKTKLPDVLASTDFTSGKLAVVVTADEDDNHSNNKILTVVLHASLDGSHKVVTTPLTHYSLSRFYSEVVGAHPLRKAAAAPDLAAAFRLPLH